MTESKSENRHPQKKDIAAGCRGEEWEVVEAIKSNEGSLISFNFVSIGFNYVYFVVSYFYF